MPLWYIEARRAFKADATLALRQLNAHVAGGKIDKRAVRRRVDHYAARHAEREAALRAEAEPMPAIITPEYLTACVRRHIGPDAIVLNEGITNYPAICDHIAPSVPGAFFASGGGSLGWGGGAAIGAEARGAGKDRRLVDRRRVLHVLRAFGGALDGAAVQDALPAGRLQQPRLEGPEVLRARRPPGRLCEPRQRDRRRLRSAAGLCGDRGCGRRRLRLGRQADRATWRRRSRKRSASCARKSAPPCSTSGWRGSEARRVSLATAT